MQMIRVYLSSDAMVNLKHTEVFKYHTNGFYMSLISPKYLSMFLSENDCKLVDDQIVDNDINFSGSWGIIKK